MYTCVFPGLIKMKYVRVNEGRKMPVPKGGVLDLIKKYFYRLYRYQYKCYDKVLHAWQV